MEKDRRHLHRPHHRRQHYSRNTKLGLDDIAFNTCGCEPLIVVHPSPTYPYHDSCAQHQVNIALLNAHSQYQQYIDSVQAGFEAAYIDHCIGSAVEVFNVNYILNEYHYTLYYYDQGGNLVRTVPPQGVNIVNLDTYGQTIKNDRDARTITPTAAKTFFTAHTLYTTYTYNSLNQLVQQQTPDGGATSFWYDRLGRIVASQNAKQAAMSPHRYSYTKYDAQGRIQEVGELATANSLTAITYSMRQAWLNDVNYPDLLDGGAVSVSNIRYQVTRTYYDATTFATAAARFTTGTQDNLRKRVVSAAIYENYNGTNTAYNSASHYTYDIHGNVKELVQEIPELSGLNDAANNRYQSYKQTRYFYDLVSGKVNEVWYQHNQADMFYYRYDYDADNRVTAAYTSTDNRQWDRDAKYAYYLHGPLARTEIGQNKVQGIDYAYTLHGWIKGVNSNALTASKDMGRDANADGTLGTIINRYVPADQYGYELTYFDTLSRQDYTSITSNGAFATQAGSGLAAGSANLWNGNIRNMVTSIKKFEDPLYGSAPVMGKAFRYDQLNRIMQAQSYTNYTVGTNSWGAGGALSGWKEQFSYDANGNILTLKRNGVTTVNTNMDDLTYHYYSNTNRLEYVDDAVSSANYSSDIDDETSANYKYDAIGNLIYDASEQIDTIRWNVYGKIERIVRKPTSTKSDLEFHYDAMGNRIVKIVKPRNGSVVLNQDNWTYTYYLRDAQGNVLAVYDRDFTTPTTTYTDAISLKENHLYGSSRVGVRAKTQLLSTATYTYSSTATNGSYVGTFSSRTATAAATNAFTHELKYKAYELSNHLGNVLVTVSDARTATNNPAVSPFVIAAFHAVVLSATDYYAFGSPMEGRSFTSVDYRYGFNGKENDPETVGTGEGLQDYGMRIYNPALGKFLSVDPLTGKYAMLTPYQFASNTPIMAIDLDGLEAAVPVTDFSMATLNIKAKDEVVNYIYVQIKGAELVQAYAMSHPEAGITEAFVKQIIWYAITTEVKRTAEVPVLCDNQSGCGICVPTGECTQTVPTQVNVFLSSSPSNQSTEGSSTTPTENAYKSSAEDLAKDIIETKYPIVKVANQFVDTWETGVGLGSGSTEALCEAGGSYTMDFISGISKAAGMTVTWVITPPNSIWENTNEIPMPPALLESGKAQNKARAEVMKRIYVLFGVAPSPQQVAKTDPENIQGTPGVDPTQRDNTRTPAPAPSSSTGN
jgi:RHS repeat-associated protein